MAALYKNIASGVVMLVVALSFETMRMQWSLPLIATVAWLVLSLGAILLLFWLIRQNAASRVASLFYLAPPLTAIEAFLLFNERLGALAMIGVALAMLGAALVLGRRA